MKQITQRERRLDRHLNDELRTAQWSRRYSWFSSGSTSCIDRHRFESCMTYQIQASRTLPLHCGSTCHLFLHNTIAHAATNRKARNPAKLVTVRTTKRYVQIALCTSRMGISRKDLYTSLTRTVPGVRR